MSHYWDCRLKGRPPGTPKSTDPNKRKRKRQGRGLGLCDVKIKIVEYAAAISSGGSSAGDLPREVVAALASRAQEPEGKVWTIQRVSGFGPSEKKIAGVSMGSGTPAIHKHTLEKSDEIKKNTVLRWVAAREKEAKKAAATAGPGGHVATGLAGDTVRKRSREKGMKLYASCFW